MFVCLFVSKAMKAYYESTLCFLFSFHHVFVHFIYDSSSYATIKKEDITKKKKIYIVLNVKCIYSDEKLSKWMMMVNLRHDRPFGGGATVSPI